MRSITASLRDSGGAVAVIVHDRPLIGFALRACNAKLIDLRLPFERRTMPRRWALDCRSCGPFETTST